MLRISFRRPFLMEVDLVEANQRRKPFYPSSVLSMRNDAAIILSPSRETTKTSKICLPHWPPAPCRSTCLHSNQPHHLPHYCWVQHYLRRYEAIDIKKTKEVTNGRGEKLVQRGTEEEDAWAKETTLGDEATSATVIRSPSTTLEGRRAVIGSLTHGYRTTNGLMKGILGFWLRTIMLM